MDIKFPDIHVRLSEEDGNAFFIIGRVTTAMKRGGIPAADISTYRDEAMGGDYDHLLSTIMTYCEPQDEEEQESEEEQED